MSCCHNEHYTEETIAALQTSDRNSSADITDRLSILSSQELFSVFRKAECCTVDGLNEYDEDFTTFSPLGNLVTHEMKKTQQNLLTLVADTADNTTNNQSVTCQSIDETLMRTDSDH